MPPDAQRDTLLHEALHAVFDFVGVSPRLDDGDEEMIIRSISPALLAVLRDNPEFVEYLLNAKE